MMNDSEPRLHEFRIKYNAGASHSAQDSYHYYNAETASKALSFHNSMIRRNKLNMQTLAVEKYNPYSNLWEDKSEILNNK